MKKIYDETRTRIKEASKRLTGFRRREYQAHITLEYFGGSARKAEREMGWGRECVQKGLKEVQSGIRCQDNYKGRGRKKTEDILPNIENDIRSLVEQQTQADPAIKGSLTDTNITGKAVRQALIDEKGYTEEELPSKNTISNMLNRMGYNLKSVLKSRPQKKIKQVDQIFENVCEANSKGIRIR